MKNSIGMVAVALFLASGAEAQAPERPLAKPIAELDETFTQVVSVRELGDGRVLVVDAGERTLFLVDFAKGSAQKVGREGSGPLEYRMPMMLLPRADSTYVLDAMLRRFLILDRAGAPVKTRMIVETQSLDPSVMLRATTIRAIDAQGRWYSQVMPFSLDTAGGAMRFGGAGFLVRWTAESPKADTLAKVTTPTQSTKFSGNPSAGIKLVVPINPPEIIDAWDVLPNGTVAVARGADYHVDYFSPAGKMTAGPKVPHTAVPITASDQARIRKDTRTAFEQNLKRGLAMAGGAAPKMTFDIEDPKVWPKNFPPFSNVRAAPDGRLWIAPPSRAQGLPSFWDVLGPDGGLVMRVKFPPRVSLVGFGKNALYAVRTDEDDLQYLQRYPVP